MDPNLPNQPYQNRNFDNSTPVQPPMGGLPPAQLTPSNLPYFLQNVPSPGTPPAPRRKPGLLIAAGVVVVLLIGLAIAAALVGKKTTTTATSTVTLATQNVDKLKFPYPNTWKKIDASSLGFTLAYGTGTDVPTSTASIYYVKNNIMSSAVKVADFNTTARKAIAANAVSSLEAGVKQAPQSCAGFKITQQTPFSQAAYFGVDVKFTCSKNSNGAAVTELDRYLYLGDGSLYRVSIVAIQVVWQQNEKLYTTINQQVLPK